MEYLFIQRRGDREAIAALIQEFESMTKQQLVEQYNRQVEIGIVGVHAQAQKIVALNIVFNRVFGVSPIEIVDGVLIKLSKQIVFNGENWKLC